MEESCTTSDGETRLFTTVKIPYKRRECDPPAILGISTDVTEQSRQRDRLRQSEARHRSLFDLSGVGTVTLDESDHIITCSKGLSQMLGVTPDACLGRPILELLCKDDREAFKVRYQTWEARMAATRLHTSNSSTDVPA